jgi:Response regulator containing a CheY-like receiver domain and an HTH DNA-binding domain
MVIKLKDTGRESKLAKVFIIDGQPLFRQGIRSSLSHLPDIDICGESDVDEQVLSAIETSPPDVVLVGADVNFRESLELCHVIKQRLPSVAIIVLSPHPDDDQFFQALKAQVSAYVNKAITTEDLVQAIKHCAHGEHPINESLINRPKVAEQIIRQFHELSREKEAASFVSPLTPRESQILDYVAQGYFNKQIADILAVSEQTIKNHITSILRKLNVNARTQAVVVAIKKGLISISRE